MADIETTEVEQTLHIARSVSVYRIPPRPGTIGWRSGEWLVSDKLFCGRMRTIAKGELCEIRLEDPQSGDLFAVCPVQYGQRSVCVEAVTDSSRYYVLRVEDSATRRHAFLGMGFDNRNDAFDFNEALVRHEQDVARERAARAKILAGRPACPSSDQGATASAAAMASAAASTSGSGFLGPQCWTPDAAAANSCAAAEVEVLYRQTAGWKLQDGQTLRVNVSGLKRTGAGAGGGGTASGFLMGLPLAYIPTRPSGTSEPSPAAVGAIALPPPPPSASPASSHGGQSSGPVLRPPALAPPLGSPLSQEVGLRQVPQQQGSAAPLTNGRGCAPGLSIVDAVAQAPGNIAMTSGQDNWATFD